MDQPFVFCPHCAAPHLQWDGINRFSCGACGFVFFHNTAAACGAILRLVPDPDRPDPDAPILLLRRGAEPARGMLDYPGGFIDPGENAEHALAREIREETGLDACNLRYFCSQPNRYEYRSVTYATCDLVFTGEIRHEPLQLQEHEVSGYLLCAPDAVPVQEIAFPSLRAAMERFLSSGS